MRVSTRIAPRTCKSPKPRLGACTLSANGWADAEVSGTTTAVPQSRIRGSTGDRYNDVSRLPDQNRSGSRERRPRAVAARAEERLADRGPYITSKRPELSLLRATRRSFVSIRWVVEVRLDRGRGATETVADLPDREALELTVMTRQGDRPASLENPTRFCSGRLARHTGSRYLAHLAFPSSPARNIGTRRPVLLPARKGPPVPECQRSRPAAHSCCSTSESLAWSCWVSVASGF